MVTLASYRHSPRALARRQDGAERLVHGPLTRSGPDPEQAEHHDQHGERDERQRLDRPHVGEVVAQALHELGHLAERDRWNIHSR